MTDDLAAAVPDGETLRYRSPTRRGGAVGLTDERLLLIGREEPISVSLTDIEEVTVQSFDWFLGFLSVVLVGFGVASIPRNAPAGVAFAVVGTVSLALTYRKRGKVRVKVAGRTPIAFHLEDTEAFQESFRRQVETYDHGEAETVDPA